MRYMKLLGASFSLALRREMAFRANLVFQLLMTIMGIVSGLAVLGVVYTQTSTLAGWSEGDALLLLGTFQVVSGIFAMWIEPNLSWFASQVKDGKLDTILVQPLPSIFLASLGKCAPLALTQVVVGLMVMGSGLRILGTWPSLWGVLGWLILVGVGLVLAWSARILMASLAFWSPSIELDVLYSALWEFGRYPVSIYRQPLRFLLTYVLPFAFLATFPAGVLTGRNGPLLPFLGVAGALLAVLLVRLVWRAGLRRYTGATS